MTWTANPWQLTPAEITALDAYIEHGSEKAAAAALGKDGRTIGAQLGSARLRMNARTRVHCILQWDRFRRSATNSGV